MEPNLADLINAVAGKLQLLQIDPWDEKGELIATQTLSFLAGIETVLGSSLASDFRWRDCEPLIEQASALLDRALADRAALQSAGEKYATFCLDIKRTIMLVNITDQERVDNRFETPYLFSKSQYESQQQALNSLDAQLGSTTQAVATYRDAAGLQSTRAGWLAIANVSADDGLTNKIFANLDGPYQGTRPRIAEAIVRDIDTADRTVRIKEMEADLDALKGQKDALEKSSEGAKAQVDWDDKNRKYLSARAEVEKEILKMKLAMTKVNWLLDFRQQISSLTLRYKQTLRDAFDRLRAVGDGMMNVYGQSRTDGTPSNPLPVLTDDEQSVDAIVAWTRKTATWLAALTRRSHNYVLPISVRATTANWDAGKSARQWSFSLPQINFGQQCYIRIRGIAGWIVGGDDNTLWSLDVQLPDMATFMYEGGASRSVQQGPVKCKLSGVTWRTKRFSPDVVGITSCYNACPIGGDWTVKVANAFEPSATEVPDDVQLDLYLSVLPL